MSPKDSTDAPTLEPFNPLDKQNLGRSVFIELTRRPLVPIASLTPFKGAGVYAVYYVGSKPLYQPTNAVGANRNRPIYVGKAVPSGARKGNLGLTCDPGFVLFNRLKEHSESISVVENLDVDDFQCRFLAVDDIWIPLAESLLIATYSPLWNVVLEGFGNHDPGKGRVNQRRSVWDSLHPGRTWAEKLQKNALPGKELVKRIQEWTTKSKDFSNTEDFLQTGQLIR